MNNSDMTWMGHPIEELDKEQLIEVLHYMGRELQTVREDRSRWMRAASPIAYLMDEQDDT